MTISDVVRRLKARPLTASGFALVLAIFVASAIWGFPPPPIDTALLAWRPPLRYPFLPPIERMPETEVEPDRDVEAAQWKSPYCLAWEDGCTECRRTAVGDPKCQPQQEIGAATCNRHEIICSDAGDERRLHQICSKYFQSPIEVSESGKLTQRAVPYETIWEFDWLHYKWRDLYSWRGFESSQFYPWRGGYIFTETGFGSIEITEIKNSMRADVKNIPNNYQAVRTSEFDNKRDIRSLPIGEHNLIDGTICVTSFGSQK